MAIALEYPDVELSHMYVDNAAMQLVRDPKQVCLSPLELSSFNPNRIKNIGREEQNSRAS